MRTSITVLLTSFAAAAFAAEDGTTPLSANEFEAFTTGKTLTYATEGNAPYGAEEYLPGRQVRWAFSGDTCKEGRWFNEGTLICFVYEDDPEPQCWTFYLTDRGLRAQFEGREETAPLYSVAESAEPLFCPGPQIGV